ncbi:IS200/IS605 family transposase [Zavarzinella formosa]|uniref:IS200/IS605 family transposase n=1 Tax=Zavarzinella formosa TaxID=360055 RepID=UPI00049865EB|nr:IS200/IS605 family transposase [Zavarzinella formosa]
MPQSHSRLFVHLIFSVKNRDSLLDESIRNELHSVLGGILRDIGSPPVIINSVEDHVHLLFLQSRTDSISEIVNKVKTNSSKWIRSVSPTLKDFHWQNGYGAFSVSQSNVKSVAKYIEEQREHHRKMTFQEEYRDFLRKHEIEFDERYVWD